MRICSCCIHSDQSLLVGEITRKPTLTNHSYPNRVSVVLTCCYVTEEEHVAS